METLMERDIRAEMRTILQTRYEEADKGEKDMTDFDKKVDEMTELPAPFDLTEIIPLSLVAAVEKDPESGFVRSLLNRELQCRLPVDCKTWAQISEYVRTHPAKWLRERRVEYSDSLAWKASCRRYVWYGVDDKAQAVTEGQQVPPNVPPPRAPGQAVNTYCMRASGNGVQYVTERRRNSLGFSTDEFPIPDSVLDQYVRSGEDDSILVDYIQEVLEGDSQYWEELDSEPVEEVDIDEAEFDRVSFEWSFSSDMQARIEELLSENAGEEE